MLKKYRERLGISREELEKLANLDRKTIFRIENDLSSPLIETFAKLIIALKLTDEEIAKEVKNNVKKIITFKKY